GMLVRGPAAANAAAYRPRQRTRALRASGSCRKAQQRPSNSNGGCVRMANVSALYDPSVNHGVAFTRKERAAMGLTGRLPTAVLSLDQQAERAYRQLQAQPTDLAKNVYLEQLHDRNDTLYYKLLADHLAELLPVVYDPTVGDAIEQYSHEYRQP